ncbi:MAG TPA: HEPN-associated N-terminal domain-containing protein [Myxococcaceae bacterium]|nr:HEPN-associated N-terminal domain-containing protein [Myxococcaceae bacterium]
MGYSKEEFYSGPAVQADGWYVCSGCFGDYALKQLIEVSAVPQACDFCVSAGPDVPVAPLRKVVDHMNEGLALEFSDVDAEGLPYDSEEGRYFGEHWSTYELLREKLMLELPNDDGHLFEVLLSALGDQTWCQADPARLTEAQRFVSSWHKFCELVKNGRRYFFLGHRYEQDPFDPDPYLNPNEILETVTALAEREGLIRTMPAGTRVFRARLQAPGERLQSPGELGPPLPQYADANRMSPQGVPVLYCADDPETALMETASCPGTFAVGEFELLKTLRILDLTATPQVPSLFDRLRAPSRQAVKFLHRFARDVSQPIKKDARVHVEYVPTQVITEYIRFVFRPGGEPLHGIRYPSAQHAGSACLVIFATQAEVEGALTGSGLAYATTEGDAWVRLLTVAEYTSDASAPPDSSGRRG